MSDELLDDEYNDLHADGAPPVADDPSKVYVICPFCGARVGVDPSQIGKSAYCPSCKLDFMPRVEGEV